MHYLPDSSESLIYINEPSDYDPIALQIYKRLANIISSDQISLNELRGLTDLNNRLIGIVLRLDFPSEINLIREFPNLKFLATATTGLTHIPIELITHPQIKLYSLRDCMDELEVITATAELTIGLILSLIRAIPSAHLDVLNNFNWDRYNFIGRQASGMKITIIGYGRLGKKVASFCSSLGMHTSFYDPFFSDNIPTPNIYQYKSLEKALADADIISLHASYEKGDPPILTSKLLDRVKPGCFIVNTARGELIDEEHMCKLLIDGHIAGIAVDVLVNEEVSSSNLRFTSLVSAARAGYNVIITPHIGGCCTDAMRMTERILANKVHQMEAKK